MRERFIKSKTLLSGVLFLMVSGSALAGTVKGHAIDSKSKEGLVGAVIYDKADNKVNATVGLDGSYVIKHLARGTHTLVAQFFGYTTLEKPVTITDTAQIVEQDFLMDAQMVNLGQVQVISNYEKGTDDYARNEEKNADYIMNVVSAKTIELSPDITIADVLQRVSGVVLDRSVTGGGKTATIRGMEATYNYTTIDDVLIPSPDYKTRYLPLDLFPADIVERVELYKTLTPDREGCAIGGGMNMILKDAPEKFSLTVDLATGYNQTLFNKPYSQFDASVINPNPPSVINGPSYNAPASDFPTANLNFKNITPAPNIVSGFTIGDRFLNNKFGVLASVSYQNLFSSTYGFFIKPQSQPNPGPQYGIPFWDEISSNSFSLQQTRAAAHIKLDYEFNPRNNISLYALYTEMDQQRSRYEEDTLGSLANSELDPHWESKVTQQHLFNTTLKGRDSIGSHLYLDWTGAYSTAGSDVPDWDHYSLTGTVGGSPPPEFNSLSRVWMQNTDNEYSGYVNLTYNFKILGQNVAIKAGGMERQENRNAFYAEYDFNASQPQPFFTNINTTLADSLNYVYDTKTGSPENANSFSVQENILAYYGMARFSVGPRFDVVGGLRIETTNASYVDGEPNTIPGQTETKSYTDYLPSVEIKFNINAKQAIRASYFSSISRPSFYDIVPYTIPGDYFTQYGNPNLDHSQANNYDLRYEFFPNPSEELLGGVFFKQIYNPIENTITRGSGPSSTIEKPTNPGGDTVPVINYGLEIAAIKYFNHFGISFNYTYTHSAITVPEFIYRYTVGGVSAPKVSDTNETRPLQGQANHVANLSFIYKEPRIGLQAQVSAVYTGKSIADVAGYYGLDLWQMPMVRLDCSFEKRLSKKIKLSLYGKVNNILNTPITLRMFPPANYVNTPGTSYWLPEQDHSSGSLSSVVVQKEYFGQTYLLGFRYKF